MSRDFLQHLLDRSTSRASALQPRLPSRFEEPIAESGAVLVDTESDFVNAPSTPAAPVPLGALPDPIRRVAQTLASVEAVDVGNAVTVSAEPLAPNRLEPAIRHPEPVVRASKVATPAVQNRRTETPRAEYAAELEPIQRHDTPPVDEPPPRRERVGLPIVVTRMAQESRAHDEPEPHGAIAALPEHTPASNILVGRAVHRQSTPALAAPSQPTVHVSIGRIEVRATPAPTAARPRDRGAKPTSLDDYLAQRNGRS